MPHVNLFMHANGPTVPVFLYRLGQPCQMGPLAKRSSKIDTLHAT